MLAKARVGTIEVLARGTKKWCRSSEHSGRREVSEEDRRIMSRRNLGVESTYER